MNQAVITTIVVTPLFITGFTGLGGAILRRTGCVNASTHSLPWWPTAVALGFASFSYLGYLVALLAPVSAWLVAGLLLGSALIGRAYLASLAKELSRLPQLTRPSLFKPETLLLAGLALTFLTLILINALTPVKEGDALQGYMFTARWLAHTGLHYNPYNPLFTSFPLNTELVFALSYPFGTDLIGKCLDLVLGLFFMGGMLVFACRFTSARYALLAVLSLMTMPEFLNNWGSGKIDNIASFIFFAGLALLWVEHQPARFGQLATAAFLLGTACSQKYTFWIFALALPAVMFCALRHETRQRQVAATALLAGIILLCLLPHFGKNISWTNNPIAPFAANLFPSKNFYLTPLSDATKMPLREAWFSQYTAFIEGLAKNGTGRLPLLALIGLGALAWAKKSAPALFFATLAAVLQLLAWLIIRQGEWLVPRFLMAPLAFLLIAGAWGIGKLCQRHAWGKWAATAATLYLLLWPGIWMHRHWRSSLNYVLGRESLAAWQARIVPARGYRELQELAPQLDANHKLLLGSELYNFPEAQLNFTCTEKELAAFSRLPDESKLSYLKEQHFAFYHVTTKTIPAWAANLPIVAEYQPSDPGALRFRIFRTID